MTREDETRAAVLRFHEAVNAWDGPAIADAITDDCRFVSTMPPDGDAYEGATAVVDFFTRMFETSRARVFEMEDLIVAGDRAVLLWNHRWTDLDGGSGNVRGVDVFRVREGKVAEKLSYVKG